MPTADAYDTVIAQLADYAASPARADTDTALRSAHLTVLDAIACAYLAVREPECRRMLAPAFPAAPAYASRIPGTDLTADPVRAAFATGVAVRWLDFNDTWLALEWGHPVDNLGGLLAVTDHLAQGSRADGTAPPTVRDLLVAQVQAHEIQGVLALGSALNRRGLDHVALVRVATAAVTARLLGGGPDVIAAATSHAFADGGTLRTYRHAPNVTRRKSWAAGDATSRGVHLALLARAGEPGCPSVLTAPGWGFQDALLAGHQVTLPRPLGTFVVENVLLKPWFPAEYHGQTAVEAAFRLHHRVVDRLDAVRRIEIASHESALRIIDKSGPLTGFADRDHCLQYMTAVALIKGSLHHHDYLDDAASDPRIDRLRGLMRVTEDAEYTRAYGDPAERAVANRVRVHFDDGTDTGWEEVRIPVGHPDRREEARPLVHHKLAEAATGLLGRDRADRLVDRLLDLDNLLDLPVDTLAGLLAVEAPR